MSVTLENATHKTQNLLVLLKHLAKPGKMFNKAHIFFLIKVMDLHKILIERSPFIDYLALLVLPLTVIFGP